VREEYEALIKKMGIDEMPNSDLKIVAKECGVEVAITLLKTLPGAVINIPKRAFNKVADQFVIGNFNGHNAKQLARVCGYSLNHIYRIVRKENSRRETSRSKIAFKQLDMFDQS
jgi:Mor family transcriptional regulator